jgi:hypothetical protein
MAGLNGSPNILAQCIPAVARASQLLCTVSQPAQARDALQQAIELLDGNGRFADVASVTELAERCRVAARTVSDDQLTAACRQLGATVARQMAVLAQEMQQARLGARPAPPAAPVAKEAAKPAEPAKPLAPPTPAPAAARPAETPKPAVPPRPAEPVKPVVPPKPAPEAVRRVEAPKPVQPAKPATPPLPAEMAKPAEKPVPVERPKAVEPLKPAAPVRPASVEKPAPAEKPRPVEKPVPPLAPKAPAKGKPASKPQVDPGLVERITVASTDAEKAAVLSALQAGKRFAVVGKDTIIDTRANRMWAARCGPTLPYRGAQTYARELRLANYADWRLPAPEELSALMAEGGSGAVKSLGMFSAESGGRLEWLWTSQSRRRFWFFGQRAACLSVRTWQLSWQKPGTTGAAGLVVRSA